MANKKKVKKKPITKKITKKTKKTSRKKKQKSSVRDELKKIFAGIVILIALCLTIAMIADIFFQPESVDKKKKHQEQQKIKPVQEATSKVTDKKTKTRLKQKSDKIVKTSIQYEVFEEVEQTMTKKKFRTAKGDMPKIVIIIDDIGYDKKIAMALCDLDPNITFSVLPFAPFGKIIAEQLHAKKVQLMLHLPMEPFEYPEINPGPGALLSSMSPDMLLDQLKKNINAIPNIVGINNHMGSKITTNSDQMNQIFTVLKMKKLFFIDSITAAKSQCKASARLFKLKFAQRDIFLDNFQNQEYISGQFKKLTTLAEKHGYAIGIGHPYQATLHTLAKELPKLKNKMKIVKAGTLTFIPG